MSTLLYNPDRKNKEQLISEFVVRTQVYEEIMHDLETSKMDYPEQHYLLVGQRGAGKTTLLNRLKYGIQDAEGLKDKVIPILFSEEQYNITELSNLWENIGQFLEDYHGFTGLHEEIEKHIEKKNFEELSYDVLERYLLKQKKHLVLLIDNIGDLLKKLDQIEVRRLREVLQTKKEIRLIAGSPFYLETILDYQQPLFEFFKVIRLDGLDSEETKSLLLKLGDIYDEKEKIEKIINETPERIETLRTLTGGVPRTIALMFRIFTEYNDESTVKDLERILDAVTPLYKHRMDDLPVQQQKIVDAVAKSWDAISVKDLKDRVRIDSKNVSAQLRQLEKNQVIEKKETGTKNHLYFLKERFFNIWYLMRYGRKDDKQRVIWLVRFLESWCSETDLRDRILNYIEKIKAGKLDNNVVQFYASLYSAFENITPETKILLKQSVPEKLSSNIIISQKEISDAMKKYYKEEKWEQFITASFELESFDDKMKAMLYKASQDLILKNQNFKFVDKAKLTLEEIINNESKSENLFIVPNVIGLICKSFLLLLMQVDLTKGEIEPVFKNFKLYTSLLDEKSINEQSLERVIIQEYLCFMLGREYYSLVSKIFSEIEEPNLKDIFKPIYLSYHYLKSGPNSQEYLKAGTELKEIIKQVLNTINKYKSVIKGESFIDGGLNMLNTKLIKKIK